MVFGLIGCQSPSPGLALPIIFNNNNNIEGIFPECFKTAKIIPIFKSGDSNSTVNYRPISMLPFLSKMFEKLMCARLDCYLKSNNILCTNQFGFRKNSNTSDAIIEFNYVYLSLDKKQSTIAMKIRFKQMLFFNLHRNNAYSNI